MQLIRIILNLGLGRVLILSLSSVPLGVIVGLSELMFGLTLMYFLSSVNLVSFRSVPRWFIIKDYLSPVFAFIFIGMFRVLINFFSLFVNNASGAGFLLKVRNNVIRSILLSKTAAQTLSLSELNNFFSSLLSRSSVFINAVLNILTIAFTIVFLFSSLFLLSFKLAVVTVVSLLLLSIPVVLSKNLHHRYISILHSTSGMFFKMITRDLKNIYFLQITGKQFDEFKSLTAMNWIVSINAIKYDMCAMTNASLPPVLAIFVALAIIMTNQKYGFVHNSVLLPFVYLLVQLNTNVGKLLAAHANFQFSKPYFIELTELLVRAKLNIQDYDAEAGKHEVDTIESLEASNLSIGRDTAILNDISFCARAGDFLCITGKSGVGKTTLLMTLIGIIPHKSGTVTINGYEVNDIDFLKFREKLAYSGPEPFLLDDTIRANLLFGTKGAHTDAELMETLSLAQCGFVMDMPEGLESVLYEGGEGISAGQKQRLSIARAVLRNPEILILDEATANIDEETEEKIITAIKEKFPHLLILAVSHRASMRQHATQMIEL